MHDLFVAGLRCEHLDNPLGIEIARPRLSWRLVSDRRGARQTAYQITATLPGAPGVPDQIWDSGRVESDRCLDLCYEGPPASSRQPVVWQVQVWDEAGNTARSAPAWWEFGLLAPNDWRARWVSAPFVGGKYTTSPAPYLRAGFAVGGEVAAARLYVAALGLVEPWLNGAPVGDDVFLPGWTDYRRRVQYAVYDVADRLRQGENMLGAILGDGWYCGTVAWFGRQHYGDRPKLLAQLEIRYADGRTQIVASGPEWLACAGPILEADLIHGESYDARLELGAWAEPGGSGAGWAPVALPANPGVALSARRGPPVRRHEELRPIDVRGVDAFLNRHSIVDFGQNIVGRVRLRVRGVAGETVRLRFAEMLNPDGSLYTANLRSARATDHYTLRGAGEEVWEPRFTFHGFRYVELSGYSGAVDADTITGIVLHSATPAVGSFHCSEPLVNQLVQNIVWGQKGNFVDVPTDCPQRDERLGWTGDAQMFIRTAAANADVAAFFARWCRDLADTQGADGRIPWVAPTIPVLPDDGGPAWSDAVIICPWTLYLCYGDTGPLAEHYNAMCRYLHFLEATSDGGRRPTADYPGWHGFGDWLALDGSGQSEGGTPKELIGTAFFAHSAQLLSRLAAVLGNAEDAARYTALFERVRCAFQERFVTPGGLMTAQTQTAYVLALHFELLPAKLRSVAEQELARDIERRDRLTTGFVGTPYLPFVLTRAGRVDLAYRLLLRREWPSWLYAVTQGATTVWERWDGWTHDRGFQDAGMNSFNHYAYGAVGAWLYAAVAGIDLDETQPGYKHILLRPRPGEGLSYATAHIHTRYGLVESAWRIEHNQFRWTVTVPPNTSATAWAPVSEGVMVAEGVMPTAELCEVQLLRREPDAVVFSLEPGTYHFTERTQSAPLRGDAGAESFQQGTVG